MKKTLPIDVRLVSFCGYSKFATNIAIDQTNQESQIKQKNIILGSFDDKKNGFYEFVVDNDTNSINYKSFENDYKKKYANLKNIGLHFGPARTHSYSVQNNKYIVVFYENTCYNVYDMKNDKWLINSGEKMLSKNNSSGSRSVLINDEIIIISWQQSLYFYFIGNDHIIDPILMNEYKLKTKDILFWNHGMCIIDFIKQESLKDELYQTYKLKIVLFGGTWNKNILSSFLYLDILLSYVSNDKSKNKIINLSIDEKLIDENKIRLRNINHEEIKNAPKWYDFGFECILNVKNEPIIVIIGGCDGLVKLLSRNIHLFNCVTYELIRQTQV